VSPEEWDELVERIGDGQGGGASMELFDSLLRDFRKAVLPLEYQEMEMRKAFNRSSLLPHSHTVSIPSNLKSHASSTERPTFMD